MKQTGIIIGIILLLLAALGIGALYFLSTQTNKSVPPTTPSPVIRPTETATLPSSARPTTQPEPTEAQPTEPQPTQVSNIPSGWLTYQNQEYGFEISYPDNYQALDDSENLYGWPNGVVLLYSGGQSYDLPIEVWDTVAEYENKYENQMDNLTVREVGGKYITLLNMNGRPEVDQIIATFKTLD